jgi:hypothetical protein
MDKNYKNTQKGLFLLFFLFLTFSVKAGDGDFAGGTGTSADPWQIATAAQLDAIRTNNGSSGNPKYFKLTADIDLGEYIANSGTGDASTTNTTNGWLPIGSSGTSGSAYASYYVVLDGDNHEITGLWINRTAYAALFSYTSSGTIIRNLGVILGNNGITGGTYVAGLVGFSAGTTNIENCYVIGDIKGSRHAGGLVASQRGTISNSYAIGTVTGGNSNDPSAGGLVGTQSTSACNITTSYANNKVIATSSAVIGGLVGRWNATSGSITNSFFNKELNSLDAVGNDAALAATAGKTTAELKTQSTYTGWDFTGTWTIDEGRSYPYLAYQSAPIVITSLTAAAVTINSLYNCHIFVYKNGTLIDDWDANPGNNTVSLPNGLSGGDELSFVSRETGKTSSYPVEETIPMSNADFAGGTGTSNDPYLIATAVQLNAMRNHNGSSGGGSNIKHFKLIADIDLGEYIADSGSGGTSTTNTTNGWLPIGHSGSSASSFYVVLDGNNHAITGLWINRSSVDKIGLFGQLSTSATIKNLGIVLDAKGITGRDNVGGLSGYTNSSNITIQNCYVIGDVAGRNNVGGVAGRHYCTASYIFKNNYVVGNVTGTESVGGLIGLSYNQTYDTYVSSSYMVGKVTGTTNVGGLIGEKDGTAKALNITNSYYNNELNAGLNAVGSDAALATSAGKTTNELKTKSTCIDWDFGGIWAIRDGKSFPYLRYQSAPIVITSFSTTDITFNSLNSCDIVAYKNGTVFAELNASSGDNTFSLPSSLSVGDILYFISYETGKPSSYPVKGIVYPKVTFSILDENSAPVADAVVTLDGTTHAAGNYVFENISDGAYNYTVSKQGYKTVTGSVTVSGNNETVTVQFYPTPVISGINPSGTNVDITTAGFDILFGETVLAVAGKTVSISDGNTTYTYTLPASGTISGTGSDCKASFLFSDFTPALSLTMAKTYTIGIEEGAFVNTSYTIGNDASSDIGSFSTPPIDLALATGDISGSTTYTGYPINPYVSIQYEGIYLKEGTDYWVRSYGQNIFVSDEAYVLVEGIGNYTGELYVRFDIIPATPSAVEFPVIDQTFDYDANLKLSDISLEGLGDGDGAFSWKDEEITLQVGENTCEIVFTPNDPDNYDYSDFEGWDASSKQIKRTITLVMLNDTSTGIPEWTNTEAKVYPNPVHDVLAIGNGQALIKKVSISDLNGRRITEIEPGATSCQFNITSWSQGVYIVTIESEKSVSRLKIVKK